MGNIFGNNLRLTIFGESHGPYIGGVIDNLPAGLLIDIVYIEKELAKRRSVSAISTARNEKDRPVFISGIKDGICEGSPLAFLIRNSDVRSNDYDELKDVFRPSHADYPAYVKYEGHNDHAGGGHFSGRLSAVLVTAGAIFKKALEDKGIRIATHIKKLHDICDEDFVSEKIDEQIAFLNDADFAVLDKAKADMMVEAISKAREEKDSLGGVLETIVTGLKPGIGEPFFDSLESELAQAMFSIGAIKGIEFGDGFAFADLKGSQANDPLRYENDQIVTVSNHNGGINGGISNGMPILFRCVVKPTPSIGKEQDSINIREKRNVKLTINGRHDPAIIHRARAVVDNMCAFVLADQLSMAEGIKSLL